MLAVLKQPFPNRPFCSSHILLIQLFSLVSILPSSSMPSEQISDQPQQDQQSQKVCSTCHSTLVDNSALFLPHDAVVCTGCREHVLSARDAVIPAEDRTFCNDVEPNFARPPHEGGNSMQNTRRTPFLFDGNVIHMPPPEAGRPFHSSAVAPLTYATKSTPLTLQCNTKDLNYTSHQSQSSSFTHPPNAFRKPSNFTSSPDPLTDITRLRVRSQGHHCLHPGATFQGTQKSGRNSYDVNVTIVVCSFLPSFLSGL